MLNILKSSKISEFVFSMLIILAVNDDNERNNNVY